jgi:small subunit ribosomal protein S18
MAEGTPHSEVRRQRHRKVCHFCKDKVSHIDYKDVSRLRRFVNDRGKIISRRTTGTCTGHQKILTRAIKKARNIALLPFTVL